MWPTSTTHDLWHKNAIIYCLDVETYRDSDEDGVGDFAGLIQRLDYLAELGVTCLWLMPFYPTPNRDDGYDLTDHCRIDPRLGTLGDFVDFMHQARDRGIRVLGDFVASHTSDQHPWFQAARRDRNSRYRDFYLWSEVQPKEPEKGVVFPGEQRTTWTYDQQAGAYYHHFFYDHEPSLNLANPAVREEIRKALGLWPELGVSGFRLDAAPFVVRLRAMRDPTVQDPYEYLREMHRILARRRGDAVLLAEANVPLEEIAGYFGAVDRVQMLFNYLVNQHLFLALVRERAEPLVQALEALPEIPGESQWANFLRNPDELDLGRLSEEERQEVFAELAPEPLMRIYGRGIRRRLAPMLKGDRRRLELAYSLLFSLPGTPMLLYGEEIGMGEDLSLDGRLSVRTPMQWSSDENGGFSAAPRDRLVRPVIDHGEYGYQKANVEKETHDPNSLLHRIRRLIWTRRGCPEIGWGGWRILETGEPSVLAHQCTGNDGLVVAVHNLSKTSRDVAFSLDDRTASALVDLFTGQKLQPADGGYRIELGGYGYRWFRSSCRHGHASCGAR